MSADANVSRNTFKEVVIDTQIWMGKNYDFGGSYPGDDEDNVTDYGRLYTWAEAKLIDFPGWHLPTQVELDALQTYLTATGGGHLKEVGTTHWTTPNTGADNTTGFSAVGAGSNETYLNQIADFWSSTEADAVNAYYMALTYNANTLAVSNTAKTSRKSVRLIKN